MRELIKNPVYMTYEEMEITFYGKWILVANCNFDPYYSLLGGKPVAVADTKFEGLSDGFYDRFKAPEYAPRTDCDFDYDSPPMLFGVYEMTFPNGGNNAAEK